jgi:hypothetical protein
MLTSFGTFFSGEGIGVHWWGDDLSVLILVAAYGLASLAFVWVLRRPARRQGSASGLERAIRAIVLELWGLFVDDGAVALVAVIALLGVALIVQHEGDPHSIAGVLLIAGVLIAVAAGLANTARRVRKTIDKRPPEPPAEEPAADLTATLPPRDRALTGPTPDR